MGHRGATPEGHGEQTCSQDTQPTAVSPPEDARPMCGAEPVAPPGGSSPRALWTGASQGLSFPWHPHSLCPQHDQHLPWAGLLAGELQAVAASRASQGPTDQPEGRSLGPPHGFHQVRSWPTGHGSPHHGSFTVPLAEHCGAFAPPGLPVPCAGSHACPRLFLWILCSFSSHSVTQTCLFMSFQINAQHTHGGHVSAKTTGNQRPRARLGQFNELYLLAGRRRRRRRSSSHGGRGAALTP